ncbi:hypothetical protein MRB53_026724 [Persea americana]|uniref:Uncharacterized protein n=1 Tax=Persea americana TaxID=3435 RepID=A0ACC2LJS5_PERAE|nr:hypothetical protein MRB53_026724 [Persea americana]
MKGLHGFQRILLLFLLILSLNSFQELRSEAQSLHPDEVKTLGVIAQRLNIKDWDTNENPCNGGWNNVTLQYIARYFVCNCTTVCHITTIELKGQNLTGELPEEFADLTFLQDLDFTLNNLNGSIPPRWATLPLVHLSILGNRVTGKIPKEFGNISTLKSLVLEDNHLGGPFPPELGNLSRLEEFFASCNNFSGPLPETFGKLTSLQMFLIDANPISGKIPDFIGNWTQITRLDIRGTSMEGPIPSTISSLTNLTQLRISDLTVPSVGFPPLAAMKAMQILVLRNCLISAEIPEFIGNNMVNLKSLDLSFNNLTGKIPENFGALSSINYMYLTNNLLTGNIPQWILSSQGRLDISNNNFTGPYPPTYCQEGNVNLVASYSSTYPEISSINSCFRKNLPCSKKPQYYSLFINCGGKDVTVGNQEYEEDPSELGPSNYFSTDRWAYSSTGDYSDNDKAPYRLTNTSMLKIANPDLYVTARLAPLSLKYYGLCLQNGNYTLQLHFAEILFTDDQTYSSNGRRLFDVSIQGERVLKDFNIEDEAGGPGLEVIKKFTTNVNNNTLEIHLYWAGKGTTAVPNRGFYGPLISAITVTPNFKPDMGESRLSVGAIVGIAAASCLIIFLILVFLYLKGCLGGKEIVDKELRGLELQTGYFSLRQIKVATNDFDPANKIGEGGFGPVYKGTMSDGNVVAVKQLSSKSKQGNLVLEIVSGKSNTNYRPKEDFVYLLDEAYVLQEEGNLLELVDPALGSDYCEEEVLRMLNVALLCTNPSPTLRPAMSAAISMLEGKIEVRAPLVKRTSNTEDRRFKAFENYPQESQTQSTSSDWPPTFSSVSLQSGEVENGSHPSSSQPLIPAPLKAPVRRSVSLA